MPAGRLGRALIIGSAAGATLQGMSMVLGLANSVVLAWALGPAGLGVYAFALAIASTVGLLAGPGLAQLVMRELAAADARRDYPAMKGLLRFANLFILATSLAVLAAGLLAAPLLELDTHPYYTPVVSALLLIPFRSLSGLRAACLVSLRKFVHGQSPERAIQPGLMLVFLLTAYAWQPDWLSPQNAIVLMIAATGASFAVGSLFLWRVLPGTVRTAAPVYRINEWLMRLVPLSLNGIVETLNNVGATLLLGLLTTPELVGLFRVAHSGAKLAQFAHQALLQVVSPEISRLWSTQDRARLQKMLTWSARLSLAVASGVLLTYIVFGADLIEFVYGNEFSGAVVALLMLTAGFVVNSACGFQGMLLTMTAHASSLTRVTILFSLANVPLSIMLIDLMGLSGGALASMLYMVGTNTTLLFLAQAKTGYFAGAMPLPRFSAGAAVG